MNLIVCGDFENGPFALEIEDPTKTLVLEVKRTIASTIEVPLKELSLYFGDKLLADDASLSEWPEMRSGAMVLAVASPLKITLQRYCSDKDLAIEIPRLAAPRWTTNTLFDLCLYKAGLPYRKYGEYVFAVEGSILTRDKRLSEYESLKNDFAISVSFVQRVQCLDGLDLRSRTFHIPSTSCIEKALTCEQKRNTYTSVESSSGNEVLRNVFGKWKLTIQKIDGTKQIVELENHSCTTVHELRMKVSSADNIRLTHGSTVLEDWDEEGNLMLLCSYPDMHDGATLYQINLTGAIRINYQETQLTLILLGIKQGMSSLERTDVAIPAFIYIEDPSRFTIRRLRKVLESCGISEGLRPQQKGHRIQPENPNIIAPDDPVSSLDFIFDGCTVFNWF